MLLHIREIGRLKTVNSSVVSEAFYWAVVESVNEQWPKRAALLSAIGAGE
jgi:hypothetical protein